MMRTVWLDTAGAIARVQLNAGQSIDANYGQRVRTLATAKSDKMTPGLPILAL
jgi:regulator of extracellular matrix RemA (YlzA/DUF370 family)